MTKMPEMYIFLYILLKVPVYPHFFAASLNAVVFIWHAGPLAHVVYTECFIQRSHTTAS